MSQVVVSVGGLGKSFVNALAADVISSCKVRGKKQKKKRKKRNNACTFMNALAADVISSCKVWGKKTKTKKKRGTTHVRSRMAWLPTSSRANSLLGVE